MSGSPPDVPRFRRRRVFTESGNLNITAEDEISFLVEYEKWTPDSPEGDPG